jgi:hypothetical protein
MGFTKKNLQTIEVQMSVQTVDESDGQTLVSVNVSHIFTIPSPDARERRDRMVVANKGKKVVLGTKSLANWNLWKECIVYVKGYDDLKADDPTWKTYFADAIGRIHVDSAVDKLLEILGSDEADQEKKLELSSEL